jgi:hypothetical protein
VVIKKDVYALGNITHSVVLTHSCVSCNFYIVLPRQASTTGVKPLIPRCMSKLVREQLEIDQCLSQSITQNTTSAITLKFK